MPGLRKLHKTKYVRLLVILAAVISGCRRHETVTTTVVQARPRIAEQFEIVAGKNIYFGHQSVGANLVTGLSELSRNVGARSLNIVRHQEPGTVVGPFFCETEIGRNGDPASKDAAFAKKMRRSFDGRTGIAMYKYCYADIDARTDVHAMFARYQANVEALQSEYPSVKFIHVTVPLTTVGSGLKDWLKVLLGRDTRREANARRNEFNRLMAETYPTGTIFNLAEVESTRPDGTRCTITSGGERVPYLCPEYSEDGGHLNEAGRVRAAAALLEVLARS